MTSDNLERLIDVLTAKSGYHGVALDRPTAERVVRALASVGALSGVNNVMEYNIVHGAALRAAQRAVQRAKTLDCWPPVAVCGSDARTIAARLRRCRETVTS